MGNVKFISQEGSLQYPGAQYIKNMDLLWGIQGGFNKHLPIKRGVGVEFKAFYVAGRGLGFLCGTQKTNKKKKTEVKLFHKVLVTKAMPQI